MKKHTRKQKLGLALLDWHGGQWSALYAVGSCLLAEKAPNASDIKRARSELLNESQTAAFKLADRLERNFPSAVRA